VASAARMRVLLAVLLAAFALATPAAAQTGRPRSILFIGNSFTFGAASPVRRYRPASVVDLNNDGVGGVPALFRTFAEQAGLNYAVSLETSGGKDLAWHWTERRHLIDRRWDAVVMQGYSTLDATKPGDASSHIRHAGLLADMFTRANPAVQVELVSTWTRADLTYRPGSPWSGKPVSAMADDLAAASADAQRRHRAIDGVVPVGRAWNLAFASGLADPNPFDGIGYGQVDLWTWDYYHASTAGYYLEALVIFAKVTGVDPRTLGPGERAADELGLEPRLAQALQRIAWDALSRP
jgi:hypothetical protein